MDLSVLDISCTWNHTVCGLHDGLLCDSASWFSDLSTSQRVSVLHFIFKQYWIVRLHHILSFHWCTFRFSTVLLLSTAVLWTVTDEALCVPSVFVSLGHTPRGGILGSHGNSNHLRNDQTILQSGWVILHPSSSVWGFRFLHHHQHLFYLLFHRGHPRGHEVASHFGIWLCTSLVANDAKQIQFIFLFLLMLFIAFLTFENHCIIQNHQDLHLCFSFSPYSSLIHLAIFCIWYPVHSFLSTWIPVVPAPFVEKATLLIHWPCHLCRKPVACRCIGLSGLPSTARPAYAGCSRLWRWKVSVLQVCSILSRLFWLFWIFCCSVMNFRISLSIPVGERGNSHWNLDGDYTDSENQLGSVAILVIMYPPIHDHEVSVFPFISVFNFFQYCFVIFRVDILHFLC